MNISRTALGFLLIPLILGFAFPAHAAMQDFLVRLKVCRSIDITLSRARCYDETIKDYDLDTMNQAPLADKSGKWKVSLERSPIDDSENVFMTLKGNDYVEAQNDQYIQPSIVLRCKEGKAQGYIVWETPLGEKEAPVKVRLGKDDMQVENWVLSSDAQAAFVPDIDHFITKLKDYETLFVEISPGIADPISSTFDLRGSAVALEPLLKACKLQDALPSSPKPGQSPQ
ncbi:MAG TPA: type VI secretion system-associated protein TagO [Micavibrio sp.]